MMLVALSDCPWGRAPSPLQVTPLETLTVYPNGTTAAETLYTSNAGHKYRVRARFVLSPGASFTGVSIVWVDLAGKEQSGVPRTETGSTSDYFFDLPGLEQLPLCKPIWYVWSAVYVYEAGGRGAYLGLPGNYVMSSQRRLSDMSTQQALCPTPKTGPFGTP
jgi:hypothetical protein